MLNARNPHRNVPSLKQKLPEDVFDQLACTVFRSLERFIERELRCPKTDGLRNFTAVSFQRAIRVTPTFIEALQQHACVAGTGCEAALFALHECCLAPRLRHFGARRIRKVAIYDQVHPTQSRILCGGANELACFARPHSLSTLDCNWPLELTRSLAHCAYMNLPPEAQAEFERYLPAGMQQRVEHAGRGVFAMLSVDRILRYDDPARANRGHRAQWDMLTDLWSIASA